MIKIPNKIIFITLLFLIFTYGIPGRVLAHEKNYQVTTLDNGMTVVMTDMPNSQIVSLYMLVKIGSATEGEYLGTGITHFLEHMLFKSTESRAVGEISEEVQSLGGSINASTSYDYTIYKIDLPYTAFDQGLDIIADMIMHPVFLEEEVKKEKEEEKEN